MESCAYTILCLVRITLKPLFTTPTPKKCLVQNSDLIHLITLLIKLCKLLFPNRITFLDQVTKFCNILMEIPKSEHIVLFFNCLAIYDILNEKARPFCKHFSNTGEKHMRSQTLFNYDLLHAAIQSVLR